jgi:hypothetical protein
MAIVLRDRVRETTATTGTGTITLDGAVNGFQAFSVLGDGSETYYAIVLDTEWEVGVGTYTSSGTTLSRDEVLESSNSGSLVNFSAGVKDVFVTYSAERSVYVEGTSIVPATAATLPVVSGGTGQSSYTDGQLLIGNTTGNTLTKATLTAGTGISITNGTGSISIASSGANSISAAITAAGTTQGGATSLTSTINNVTVVTASDDGVKLPTAIAGIRLLIRNSDSADTLKIYPDTGAQINALGTDVAYNLLPGGTIEFFATTTTQWYSFGTTGWGGV